MDQLLNCVCVVSSCLGMSHFHKSNILWTYLCPLLILSAFMSFLLCFHSTFFCPSVLDCFTSNTFLFYHSSILQHPLPPQPHPISSVSCSPTVLCWQCRTSPFVAPYPESEKELDRITRWVPIHSESTSYWSIEAFLWYFVLLPLLPATEDSLWNITYLSLGLIYLL